MAARYCEPTVRLFHDEVASPKPADLPLQAPTKYEVHYQSQDRQGTRSDCPLAAVQ